MEKSKSAGYGGAISPGRGAPGYPRCCSRTIGCTDDRRALSRAHHGHGSATRTVGNAIFVGRGANIITANQKSVLHVRLMAPFSKRVRQIEEHHRLGTQEAVELISTTDDMRRRYIKHYYRAEIDDPINYHFTINTGLVGYEEAAQIIADATMNLQARG